MKFLRVIIKWFAMAFKLAYILNMCLYINVNKLTSFN